MASSPIYVSNNEYLNRRLIPMFGSRETQRVTTQTVVSPTADANLLLPPPSAAPLTTPSSLCSRRRPPPPPSAPAAEAPPPSRAPTAAAPSSSLCVGHRGPLLLPLLRPPRPALLPRGQRGRGRRGGRGRGGRAGVDGEGAHLGRGEKETEIWVSSRPRRKMRRLFGSAVGGHF